MFNFHIYQYPKNLFSTLTLKLNKIMATISDLEVKISELQATVDAEQAQIEILVNGQTQTIAALEAQIVELEAMLSTAPTPEQIQAVVDGLEVIKADISGTIPDAGEEPAI